ncbi:hypothetical protein AB9K26_08190 [Psychroserpens sp. XS_ASV72]|uniref:hypothetical protein n=1 Tax=Psychroserpens sp. XS_ASV72 TaxID=3241293 RepID=UPI003517E650
MNKRRHVMISGTGRSGTSFLVELLTNLGLDTGYNTDSLKKNKNDLSHAGLEKDIRKDNCPYIVKNPWFCDYADEIFAREDILVEHVFIPIRNLNAAAQSRINVTKKGIKKQSLTKRMLIKLGVNKVNFPGGTWHTNSLESNNQEHVLLNQLYKLMLSTSDSTTDVTLIKYPRLTKDPAYLHKKLQPIMKDITYDTFLEVFNKTVKPELVSKFNSEDA